MKITKSTFTLVTAFGAALALGACSRDTDGVAGETTNGATTSQTTTTTYPSTSTGTTDYQDPNVPQGQDAATRGANAGSGVPSTTVDGSTNNNASGSGNGTATGRSGSSSGTTPNSGGSNIGNTPQTTPSNNSNSR